MSLKIKLGKREADNKIFKNTLKYHERIMIKYIVGGLPLQDFCDKYNISINRCRKWLRKTSVLESIEKQTTERVNIDINKRKKRSEFLSTELYSEIINRISDGGLESIKIGSLFRFYSEINKDIRSDTPSEINKDTNVKVTVQLTEDISRRYLDANSLKEKERIIDMTVPKQILEVNPKPEDKNGVKIIQQKEPEDGRETIIRIGNTSDGRKPRSSDK